MINSLLGALGCRIRITSSLGTSYTGSASGLTACMSSSTRYNPYPTPAYLITNSDQIEVLLIEIFAWVKEHFGIIFQSKILRKFNFLLQ